ncbi:MAG TPA: type IV pilus modification protein PilV [Rhodocyclaceae bacterium]|nr:type IV pilus modification protein PilV [Rhodocyclaceae bacterium]
MNRSRLRRFGLGLTLIEVMVTLVILLLGLLGLSGMIVKAQRLSYEAYERQQALAIATDLAERMRANQSASVTTPSNGAIAALYAADAGSASPLGDPALAAMWTLLQNHSITDCAAADCSPSELANYDLASWEGLLLGAGKSNASNLRIGSISNARGCVEGPVAFISPGVAAPTDTYRITVAWQGDQAVPTSAGNASDLRNLTTCAKGLYQTLANTPDSADEYRRLVTLYVFIYQPS